MVLQFKKRGNNDLKKVMIYGKDGSGKSTFAETYCNENNLHPVVIDIDDTNYTNLPILDLNLKNDLATFKSINTAVSEISKTSEFDTIIIDGVTSLLELLVSNAKGLAKYSDRAVRFQKILQGLLSSGKHLIFIGQADMEVIYNEDVQSSKMVIKVNSIVNEKYLCEKNEKGEYTHKVVKFRTYTGSDNTTIGGVKPEPADDDPLRNICIAIKNYLEEQGKLVTKSTMKSVAIKRIKAGIIDESMRPALIKYIQDKCPEDLRGGE